MTHAEGGIVLIGIMTFIFLMWGVYLLSAQISRLRDELHALLTKGAGRPHNQ